MLLYGSETWRESSTSIKLIKIFVNKCLRNIFRIRLLGTIGNIYLWESTKQQLGKVTTRTQNWTWHMLRIKSMEGKKIS